MPKTSSSSGDSGQMEELLATLLRKDLIEKPPQFTVGGNITRHLQKLDKFFGSINVQDDVTKKAILFTTLSENAAAELRCQPDFNENDTYMSVCQMLKSIFHIKESAISPLLHLLKIKQKDGQSLREFMSELRVAAVDFMVDNPAERERLLVSAFVNGLIDKNLTIALKAMSPNSLEIAYKMIKYETSKQESNTCGLRLINTPEKYNSDSDVYRELQQVKAELTSVQTQLRLLTSAINNQDKNRNTPKNFVHKPQFISQNRMLNNTQKPSNLAQRTKQIICFNCNKSGHIARFCQNGYRTQNRFRYIKNEEGEDQSNISSPEAKGDVGSSEADFFCINTQLKNVTSTKPKIQQVHSKKGKVFVSSNEQTNKLISPWLNYIEGNARKPKCKTVISNSNSEKAANKPIVRGFVGGKRGKIFCDSGAEINLINTDTAIALQKLNPKSIIRPNKCNIKCANGSLMENKGVISLEMRLGGKSCKHSFILVDSLFPRVILGIKSMKTMGLIINPSKDCVEINGVSIPFISKIECVTNEQENGSQSILSTGN